MPPFPELNFSSQAPAALSLLNPASLPIPGLDFDQEQLIGYIWQHFRLNLHQLREEQQQRQKRKYEKRKKLFEQLSRGQDGFQTPQPLQ